MVSDLTIAICAKNAENTIGKCLDSIKKQSVKADDTYVVVYDENDTTIPIVRKHRVSVIISKGKALYNQRNTALRNCKTKYIAFTDADCVLDKDWVKNILKVFKNHPEVAAGTGRHPMGGKKNWVAHLHHLWYIVETLETGYTNGVIGGNSYFRTDALRKIGGWPSLELVNAEDVIISKKIEDRGYKIWFDEEIKAYHQYKTSFRGLWKTAINMGYGITVMMDKEKVKDQLYYYTMLLPLIAFLGLITPFTYFINLYLCFSLAFLIYIGTLFYWIIFFKSIRKAFPRWIARWILIFPYSIGILNGKFKK